jgi:hypothetical protein
MNEATRRGPLPAPAFRLEVREGSRFHAYLLGTVRASGR